MKVAWNRVGFFYAVSLGGAVLVAGLIWLLGGLSAPISQLLLTVLYMPLPLVAGLLTEKRAGRTWLLKSGAKRWRKTPWQCLKPVLLWSLVAFILIAIGTLAMALLGSALAIPGAGRIATAAELVAAIKEIQPDLPADFSLNPIPFLVISTIGAITAGFTINGLVAFGEEYGWRGVLADELRPLGAFRANLLTGVLWGLWHAPVIILGHNYGSEWGWGIPLMIAMTTPLSFILWWARERSGSVLAPAVIHGAINGFLGNYSLVIVGGDFRVGLPVGILLGVTLTVIAAGLWWFMLRQRGLE